MLNISKPIILNDVVLSSQPLNRQVKNGTGLIPVIYRLTIRQITMKALWQTGMNLMPCKLIVNVMWLSLVQAC